MIDFVHFKSIKINHIYYGFLKIKHIDAIHMTNGTQNVDLHSLTNVIHVIEINHY
jgi:hypothetical protein